MRLSFVAVLICVSVTVTASEFADNMIWLPIAGHQETAGNDQVRIFVSPDVDAQGNRDLFIYFGGFRPVVNPVAIELSSNGRVVYANNNAVDLDKAPLGMVRLKVKLTDIDLTTVTVSKLRITLK